MKKFTSVLILLVVLFGIAQLIRPPFENPAVTLEVQVPDSIKNVFKKGCYDCHSNETALKWFDKITPANFLVASHIRKGRKALNFSNWDSQNAGAQRANLFWAVNDIRRKEMAPNSYLMLHGDARLNGGDLAVLERYLSDITLPVITKDTSVVPYREIAGVKPEWNDIAFIPDFQNWKAISITDRFDNATLRVIYGNDIAVKAITENKINPWPDGTILAKAAWKDKVDSAGMISAGSFWQVEFMVKDSKKYASTLGWGFARWRGAGLQPYGKDASFTGECVTCHRPLKNSDYTFTFPLKPLTAAPLNGKLTGISVNTKHRTMSVSYDNGTTAVWSQRADPNWFGARIPDSMIASH